MHSPKPVCFNTIYDLLNVLQVLTRRGGFHTSLSCLCDFLSAVRRGLSLLIVCFTFSALANPLTLTLARNARRRGYSASNHPLLLPCSQCKMEGAVLHHPLLLPCSQCETEGLPSSLSRVSSNGGLIHVHYPPPLLKMRVGGLVLPTPTLCLEF